MLTRTVFPMCLLALLTLLLPFAPSSAQSTPAPLFTSTLPAGSVVYNATWSPDGTRLALSAHGFGLNRVVVIDAAAGTRLADLDVDNNAEYLSVAWAEDGTRLRVESGSGDEPMALTTYDAVTGEVVENDPTTGRVYNAARTAYYRPFTDPTKEVPFLIEVTSLRTGATRDEFGFVSAWGGERLLFSNVGASWVIDTGTAEEILRVESWQTALSPDGTLLAAAYSDRYDILRVEDGALLHTLPRPEGAYPVLQWTADGARLLAFPALYAMPDATPLLTLDPTAGEDNFVADLTLDPAGDRLLFAPGGHVQLWQVGTGVKTADVVGDFAHFSPDGSHIVVWYSWGGAALYDSATGDLITPLPHFNQPAAIGPAPLPPVWSPDGTRLVTITTPANSGYYLIGTSAQTATAVGLYAEPDENTTPLRTLPAGTAVMILPTPAHRRTWYAIETADGQRGWVSFYDVESDTPSLTPDHTTAVAEFTVWQVQ